MMALPVIKTPSGLTARFLPPIGWMAEAAVVAPDITLRVGHAVPDMSTNGTILLLHGMGQCLEDYYETIHDFLDHGYAVASFDWYGQGASSHHLSQDPFDPLYQRLHITDVDVYARHIRDVLALPSIAALPGPLHVVTHSMGGLLFLHAACMPDLGLPPIASATLVAPFLGMPVLDGPFGFLARQYLAYKARQDSTSYPVSALCHDWNPKDREGAALRRYTSDPFRGALHNAWREANPVLRDGGPTALCLQTLYTDMTASRRPERLNALTIPIQILQAGDEQVVNNRPLKYFVRHGVTCHVVQDSAHEALNERDVIRNVVLRHILHWARNPQQIIARRAPGILLPSAR